ncbi:hypothetical protein J6590_039733 [Homalodisca vitripennis]|nr:hypothetical protein J6590_039733 [Homalodisca vitripennis]
MQGKRRKGSNVYPIGRTKRFTDACLCTRQGRSRLPHGVQVVVNAFLKKEGPTLSKKIDRLTLLGTAVLWLTAMTAREDECTVSWLMVVTQCMTSHATPPPHPLTCVSRESPALTC